MAFRYILVLIMAFGFFKKNKQEKDGQFDQKEGTSSNNHYYDLKVKEIVRETRDAISIVFEMPEPEIHY